MESPKVENETQEQVAPDSPEAVEEGLLDILYAANIMEDWEGLRDLRDYMLKRRPDLLILTNILQNPLTAAEQVAFRDANHYVADAFRQDGNFSDPQLFVESFRQDSSMDVVAVSARKILRLIELGKLAVAEKMQKLSGILERCPCPYLIVPGQFENVDLIQAQGPPEVASRYLSVRKAREKELNLLGVGGLPGLSNECPALFQDREYIDGTGQAVEYLEDVFGDDVDILITFAPVRHFTDEGEEGRVRDFLSQRLPGKLVLTSQTLKDYEKTLHTASGGELIRGGHFGQGGSDRPRVFWELSMGKKGLADKSLFELKQKKSFRLI